MSWRILISGADSDYAIERFYRRYLPLSPDIGAVDFFPAQNIFHDFYYAGIVNKISYRLGFRSILRRINAELLKRVALFKPDILLVFKGMEILPETLKELKGQGIKLVNFNPDNPFVFSGRGSGNKYVRRAVALYDLYLSYDASVVQEIKDKFGIDASILPFGFDPEAMEYARNSSLPEIKKVCFIGNYDRQRAYFLNALARLGVFIDLYGSRWPISRLHPNISYKGYARDKDFWDNVSRYRVQLNLMRKHNPGSHNMRSFEIPAVGGVQLAPFTTDHIHFFEPDNEIFIYHHAEDCAEKINMLLALPDEEVVLFRGHARSRCHHSGYSYQDRSFELAAMFSRYFENKPGTR
jgi:hypothetical protein